MKQIIAMLNIIKDSLPHKNLEHRKALDDAFYLIQRQAKEIEMLKSELAAMYREHNEMWNDQL